MPGLALRLRINGITCFYWLHDGGPELQACYGEALDPGKEMSVSSVCGYFFSGFSGRAALKDRRLKVNFKWSRPVELPGPKIGPASSDQMTLD